jgi:hypothetical protein
MFTNLTLVSCLLLPHEQPPIPPRTRDFEIRAEPITVMDGGPFIVKVTFTYRGSEPLSIQKDFPSKSVWCEVPHHWRFQVRVRGGNGLRSTGAFTLNPGDSESETLYLHHMYANITKGKAKLRLTWPIYEPGENGQLLARPSMTLALDIPPADAAHLALLRKKLEQIVNRRDFSEKDWWNVNNHLRYTKHDALAPVVWRMIEKPLPYGNAPQLIALLHGLTEPPRHGVNSRFVDLISSQGWEPATLIFDYWRSERIVLPAAEFDKLVHSKYVSTRLLTYITFPRQCDKAWTAGLIEELRNLTRPVPPAEFSRLLRGLDDDNFAVRQKTSNHLVQLGERVKPQLTKALHASLSAEADLRIRSALDKIEVSPYPPGCYPAIRYLVSRIHTPEADVVLTALAEGDSNLWLTDYAKAALKDREKPPSGK